MANDIDIEKLRHMGFVVATKPEFAALMARQIWGPGVYLPDDTKEAPDPYAVYTAGFKRYLGPVLGKTKKLAAKAAMEDFDQADLEVDKLDIGLKTFSIFRISDVALPAPVPPPISVPGQSPHPTPTPSPTPTHELVVDEIHAEWAQGIADGTPRFPGGMPLATAIAIVDSAHARYLQLPTGRIQDFFGLIQTVYDEYIANRPSEPGPDGGTPSPWPTSQMNQTVTIQAGAFIAIGPFELHYHVENLPSGDWNMLFTLRLGEKYDYAQRASNAPVAWLPFFDGRAQFKAGDRGRGSVTGEFQYRP